MTNASKWLRRAEISLWVIGISLLGVALEASVDRWQYQSQQERALFAGTPHDGPTASFASSSPSRTSNAGMQYETPLGPERPATFEAPTSEPQDAGKSAEDLTERASNTPPAKTKLHPAEADPTALGRIEIPRLGLKAIVRDGADDDTLERAVGLVPGTGKPGDVGNMVLAGHRDTFFRSLRKIKVDDTIRLVVPPHTYEYRVASLRVVAPTETSVMDSNGIEELTLVTCYPFRFLGPAPDRFIVSATRVE